MDLTAFPNLHSTQLPGPAGAVPAEEILAGLPQVPDETVLRAWAALLHAYTGVDAVRFLVDEAAVEVGATSGSISRLAPPQPASDLANVTRVCLSLVCRPTQPFSASFPLTLRQTPSAHPAALTFQYDRDAARGCLVSSAYLPGQHLRHMAQQLRRCIAQAHASSESSPPPTDVALSVLNPHPEALEGPRLLHQLVQWAGHSARPAIDHLGHDGKRSELSYSTLDRVTTSLASTILLYLTPSRPHPVVPLLVPQSPELYIAQLAILKAGGAFCPLNLDAPSERVKFIIEDVSAKLVITTPSLRDKIPPGNNVHVLLLEDGCYSVDPAGSAELPSPSSDDLAYVMYTSGSTGTPKGVGVSHFAATQSLLAHDRHIPSFSRFLQFAAPTFDVSVFEIFFPLFKGCTLVTCDRTVLLNDLPAAMRTLEVDAAELTPTVAGTLLQTRNAVPKLKLLLTIGEMLSTQIVQEFGGSEAQRSMLWGMYGPTEAAIHCTLQPSFSAQSKVGNIGVPLDTVSAIVVAPPPEDQSSPTPLEILPIGQVGELAVGGHQLAVGYLNRPEQTAAAFVDHPEYGRLYRTGDKARLLPDGTLECLGRISTSQVKLRGQRVELGEVEQALTNIKGCRSVTACVISGILVAFILAQGCSLNAQHVIEESKRWLPTFMVPGDVVILDDIPRLPSGKVDRKGLEANYKETQDTERPVRSEYADETESHICTVLSNVLQETVHPTSNLAALGLDSLKAIRVASALRLSDYSLGAIDVLSTRDAESLASLLKGRSTSASVSSPSNDTFKDLKQAVLNLSELRHHTSDIEDVLGCTPLQAAMLAETSINPRAYCNWVELEIHQKCSALQLKSWLTELTEKNNVLRSGFCALTGSTNSYAQIIWSALSDKQVVEVDEFQRDYELDSPESLLRPLKFQILTSGDRYRVLCQIPHALYDGWSMDLIVSDLNTLVSGREAPERPQFRDVAVHFATTSAADLDPSLSYWKTQLEDYTYASIPNFNGKKVSTDTLAVTSRALSTPLEQLRQQASMIKVNSQVFFQAALAFLASFYFNTHDITFGTVTSGRTIPVSGIEEIVGPCIATLPLRLDVSRSRMVRDLLLHIHELNRAMLSHCELPLRDVKKSCGLEPGSPLFDILFVWQETLHSNGNEGSLVSQVDGADQLEFKLTLEFEPRTTGLVSKATYDPAVLPKDQIDIIISQIEQLVGFFLENVDAELTQQVQRMDHSVLSIENADFKHEEISAGPSHAVETRAEQHPNAAAVAFSSNIDEVGIQTQTLTYRELNSRANQLSSLLLSQDVKPDDLVCICMEKSIDLYVSILAVLKVGAGYVPITPETPLERVRFIFDEAKIRTCLTTSDCLADIRSLGDRNVLDVDQVKLGDFSIENPNVPYDGSRVAYGVFTSGSTGTPKGVLVTQDNLVSNLKVLSDIYPCPEGSRLLQSCSQAFDVSVFEIFFSWYAGMCLCSGTKDELFQDMELAIRQMGITHLSLTPTVAALVNPHNVPSVKFLVTAGEAVTEHVKRAWAGKGLYQGYGPSETTNICTVRPRVTHDDLINNIGAPFTNTSAFVMDEVNDVLVPRGGVGELCFGGDQVFRGYLNMPELTAKKIIEHPTWGRIYRSGDMGRLCPDGSILFTGRSDDQIKLRGQRIELGEINSCILDSTSVTDCVTLLMGVQNKTAQQLVSFWVPTESSSPATQIVSVDKNTQGVVAEIFDNLANKLPVYMLPNALVPVTAIPMTVQGKTDKRKLAALYEQLTSDYIDSVSRKSGEAEEAGDWSEMERATATILANVLKMPVDEIKRQASFFAYGLDSISAISLSNGLKEAGLPRIPVSAILQNANVLRLARFIAEKSLNSDARPGAIDPTTVFSDSTKDQILSAFNDEKVSVCKVLPCSPLQEAMLSAGGSSEAATYLNKMVFKVQGDHTRLRDCWTAMCKRHEILRTCFVATDDPQYAFAQVVLAESMPLWDEIDANEADKYVESIAASMAESHQPPLRFATMKAGNSTYLLFCCHHALYDGAAMGQLMTEVEQIYCGDDLPTVVPFEPFLAEMVQTRSEETDRFWSGRLQSLEPTSFPDLTGLSAAARKTKTERSVFVEDLPFSLSALESDCRKLSCTLLALGQAAWAKILSLYTGESDICFGNVVSGRTLPIDGLDRLVAPCFNTLPVRVDLSANSKNSDLLGYLSTFNADSLPYQLTPLRRIQAMLSNDGTRLFDTLFILQQTAYHLNEKIWSLEEDTGEMDFPLVCELIPDRRKDALALALHFHEAKKATADKLPSYMVPNFLILVNRIPLSAAGKVDKRALKSTFQDSEEARQEPSDVQDERDWTTTELEIREALAVLSKVSPESIGLQTTIYQLGLDSISAVQVAARLRKKGFKITASDVLDRPTCADLALLLQRGEARVSDEQMFDFKGFEEQYRPTICQELKVGVSDIASVHPCTPLQAGMISQFLHSDGKMYLNYMHYQFDGINSDLLEQALRSLYEQHGILRSGFVHVNNTQSPFALVTYTHDASVAPISRLEGVKFAESEILKWREDSRQGILRGLCKNAFRALLVDVTGGVSLHLTILHSLYDAQSLRILLDEVAAFCLDGKVPAPKPFEPVLSSILLSSSDDSDERKGFWEEKGNDVFVNAFPSMTPLRVKEGRTRVSSKICAQRQSELEAGCRKTGITMQAAGQAAWARLLAGYIGEDAATFGVVFSGRNDERAESTAFPCITTVPLPARNNPDNRALLNSMMTFNTAVRKHQFTPLTRIQRWTGHPDEALFDTIFAYQKLSDGGNVKSHWKLVDEDATVDVAVSIELEPTDGDQLELRITYGSDRLPEEQAKVILNQLDRILLDLIFHPDGHWDDAFRNSHELLSITPPKEREIKTDVTLLHEFVERSARQFPDKIAFEFATEIEDKKVTSKCWTYKELDEEGNKIANLLKSKGVEPGGLVAICFDKCPEASFGILGILKAGCAYVALDPGAPVARKAFITQDSRATMVVSMKNQTEPLQGQVNVPIVNLDDIDYSNLSAKKPELSRAVLPQDLSYCLYTSGTTGTPKGCELTHENAVQAMLAFSRLFYPRWDADSKWLQFASFHFDVSVLEQYWTWSEGIRLVSAPRDLIFEDLAGSITALGITHIDLTPSLAKQLTPDQVPTLLKGVFITGGEALKQEILDDFGRHEVIHNGYGPTEATIGVTMFPRVPDNGKPSNIGPQFDNVGSFVFRPKTNIPVMRGAVGELCVSGKLVGKGYLNRPDLTNEKFPYLEEFDEKVYRTGDLVRILHDGSFDFLGRADDQVKLRGQRLEIGEINSVINQSEAEVLDTATLVLKHPKQQKDQLVSFIVTKSTFAKKEKPAVSQGGKDAMHVAAEACRSKLPAYMVPTHFIPLTSMPLSPNNKADGKQLKLLYAELSPEQLQAISTSSGEGGAISTANEKKIAEVLASMASVDDSDISRHSSIFELGLDSISVIGFAGALRKAGFRNAHASVVMKNPVVSRLAKALSSKDSGADRASIQAAKQNISACQHQYKAIAARSLGVQQDAIEGIAPCSPLQQGIISRSLESDKPVYFATFRFELAPDVDLSKLQAAWERAYESIQILRARFVPTDNGYIQVILRGQQLPWIETPVTNPEEVEEYLDTRKLKWWSQNRDKLVRPFELVTTVSPGEKILSVHIMHVVYDGASLPMLLQKVEAEYKGEQQVDFGPAFLEVLPYGPLRNMSEAPAFWTAHLSTARSCIMPSLISNAQDQDVTINATLDDLESFESTRRKLDVTHQALVQASWTSVLQKYFDGGVTLGMVVSGRSIDFEGADRTIGPMFNTVPFNLNFTKDDTWNQVVRRCHDFNTSSLPYQHTPLRDIMKWSKRPPSEPLFDTLFVFQKELEDGEPDKSLWSLLEDQPEADYPLALEVEQKQNGSLGLTIVAQGQVADHGALTALLDEFRTALQNLLEDPEALVSDTVGAIHSSSPAYTNGVNGHANGHLNGVEGFEWTPVARRLQEEIATLAGLEPSEVDEHTTIFELGLDSIDAIKLSSRLKKSGINLPVSQIMRSLTIPRMANEVTEKAADSQAVTPGATLDSQQAKLTEHFRDAGSKYLEDVERILPVTPLQEAMVAEMFSSEFHHYFNHDVLRLAPGVDVEKMKQAWVSIHRSSAVLRTTFEEVDDPNLDLSFAQVIHKAGALAIGEIQAASEEEIDTILDTIRARTAEKGGKADIFQVNIIRCKSNVFMSLSIAHALYDGWSLGLLHSDVQAAYAGDVNVRPAYDHVLEDILNASGDKAASFWRDFLGGAPSGLLSEGRVQDLGTGLQVHRKEHTASVSVDTLRSFCKNAGITLQALGQTCWSLVLSSYLGRLDLVFGVVLSGRDSQEAEDVMFPTMNTVAVRSIIHGTRKEMLRYMQENISTMRQFQHYPLRRAKAAAETGGKSLFDTLFIFQTRPGDDASGALYESIGGAADVEYPVAVEMEAVGDSLVWRTACKSNVFDEAGSEQLLNRIDMVLKSVVASPDSSAVSYGDDGASVCGLPPFKDLSAESSDVEDSQTPVNGISPSTEWTGTEKTIREVLSTVSKVPESEVTKELTIFHLGLDSISAIKVSSLLKRRSIKLSVSEMLRAATVEKMAQIVESRQMSTTTAPETDPNEVLRVVLAPLNVEGILDDAKITPGNVQLVMPATPGQTFMLSVWQKTEGSILFPSFKYHIKNAIDEERLREAWAALVSDNSILRTVMVATGNKETPFLQVILKQAAQGFQAINVYTPSSPASPKKLQKKRSSSRTRSLIRKVSQRFKNVLSRYTEEEREPLPQTREPVPLSDNTRQPFARLVATKQHDGWLLTVKLHHTLYDGVSLPILMQQFETLCNQPTLKPTPSTAFPALIAASASPAAASKRQVFWSTYFKDATPTARLQQPRSARPGRVSVFKPDICGSTSKVATLEAAAMKQGINVQSLFLAAYARLYARLTADGDSSEKEAAGRDAVFGIWLANRSHAIDGLADVAAPTVNLVPLRVRAPLTTNAFELAKKIQEDLRTIGDGVENAGTGLWEIERWTGVKVDSFVNFLKLPEGEDEADKGGAGGRVRVREVDSGDMKEGWSRVEKSDEAGPFEVPAELRNNVVGDAYLVSHAEPSI
ncbi:Hydroxamate-type ferrichrome siderophore peptide synthetase [Diplodia seriata]|uniref:Hydroxamate-type ferrichrome siderophore peptide synthetase n=1 Tax=Diplodia seriata TaxID=420778 RepID=A0A1S8B306_9PEZI|nr:Hydroxamate-type ferrichrome siderophore peptide synthetase [Diplodia seriata]